MSAPTYRLLVHIPSGRPLCALLQAVVGGDRALSRCINSKHWLIAPPADGEIVAVTGTAAEWAEHERRLEGRAGDAA